VIELGRYDGLSVRLAGCVQQWDEVLPNGYKTSGLKLPNSQSSKRSTWDGSFSKQRHNVANELEVAAVGYGASGKLLATVYALHCHAASALRNVIKRN